MASAKMGTKAKMKDERNRTPGSQEEPDGSLLRKPIQTSITGFAQARKIFDSATEELKSLLSSECDLLYECKVCRNLFRSLANFIAHKRVYCKEVFNSTIHGHFIKPVTTMSEIMKIRHVEEGYQEYKKNRNNGGPEVPRDRVPMSKDVTAVVENLMKNGEATAPSGDGRPPDVAVQRIPTSSVAVFQNLVKAGEDGDDMCSEVIEIDSFMAKDSAVLKEDGKFETCAEQAILDKETANNETGVDTPEDVEKEDEKRDKDEEVIQISDDDESNPLVCKICDIKFSTRKTHKFHMKYKHVADRLVYPCTDCCDIFSTSWSVLRHLYRVHRKTLTQIRRMREVVQSRAFRMDNMPMSYVKKKNSKEKVSVEEKLTEDERIDQENQAWMDNMESDSELPRCGGCGRSFERRAALAAHTYTCQSRTRALARKPNIVDKVTPKRDVKPMTKTNNDGGGQKVTEDGKTEEEKEKPESEGVQEDSESMEVDKPQVEEQNVKDEENEEGNAPGHPLDEMERANMEALKKKMSDYLDKWGGCRLCKRKYTTPSHLCRHMATHFAWRRFGCKLCNYTNYDRNRLVTHAQTIHKLRGSEEFYWSIIRVLSAEEAVAQSTTPKLEDSEWNKEEEEEDSSESEEINLSSDDSESSNSRTTEIVKTNRRKQTFKPVKIKSKSNSPDKDEEKPDKAGVKRSLLSPSDKMSQVAVENSNRSKTEKKDESSTDSGRPVRKRMRPKKDKDFEYDFSNLIKWEANSYKEMNSRSITNKRKSTAESSPSEGSPEKVEKTEKDTKDDKVKIKIDEKKKAYAGALATMSDRAVAQARAHLRPQILPFQIERNSTKASEVTQQVRRKLQNTIVDMGRRKSISTPTSSNEQNNSDKTANVEKQTEDANSANKSNVFKPTNYRSIVQSVKTNPEKPAGKSLIVVKQLVVDRDTTAKLASKYQIQKILPKVKAATVTDNKPDSVTNDVEILDSKEKNVDDVVTGNGNVSLSDKVATPECIEIM